MGPSKVLNEPKCGSRALIPTHVCKNYIPNQLSAREFLSRLPKPEHGGQRPCSVGLESVARISTRYPRGNSYPFRNTTALWHKNGPEPYQGARLTPPAVTSLQGRDPYNNIPDVKKAIIGFTPGRHTAAQGLTT